MKNLVVADPESFSLRHLNLGRTEFRGTSLRNLQFLDVDWYETQSPLRKKFRAHSRRMLYDEGIIRGWAIEPRPISLTNTSLADNIIGRRTTFNLSELEVLRSAYQRLCQNYEENQSRVEAEDFHYGEMEMRRLKLKPINRFFLSWEFLYWLVSGYGGRWVNSLICLMVALLMFPSILLFTGVSIVQDAGLRSINYDLAPTIPSLPALARDYWQVAQYNWLSVFFTKDVSAFYSATVESRLVQTFEILLLPIFTTLFILALRRRFKR